MSYLLFEILINLFQSWLMLFFMKSRLHPRKPCVLADIFCITSCTLFYSSYLFVEMPTNDILVFTIPFIYALYLNEDKWYISLFWTLMLAVLFSLSVGLITHMFISLSSSNFDAIASPGILRIAYIFLTNIFLSLIIFFASKLEHDYWFLTWPSLTSFFLICLSILITEECLFYLQNSFSGNSIIYNLGYFSLLTCSLLSFLLFHLMTKSSVREHRYKYEISLYTFTLEHQSEFKRMYESFTSYRHDLKHHLEALDMLIAQKATKEAQAYLEGYKAEFEQFHIFTTGSPLMDALLTAKVMTMKENGIQFHYVSYPLNRLPIEETKLCAIVGNLLDNAIEGVLRIEDPSTPKAVSLRFSRIHDVFRITCTNPCNTQTLRREKDAWRSSKREAQRYSLHGIGISNINRLVDEANGFGSFTVRGDVFHVSLSIPFPKSAGIKEAEHEPNR